MSEWCGGCARETWGMTAVYRLDMNDGKVSPPSEKRLFGNSQPNCYVCRECWEKVPSSAHLTESQAISTALIAGDSHVLAHARTDGEQIPTFFRSEALDLIGGRVKAVIDGMHRRQLEFARQQALCEAEACKCAKQEKPWADFDGAIGLPRGTRVVTKRRRAGDVLEDVHGVVLRHEHPPQANWHLIREDGPLGLPVTCHTVYKVKS
jgi:hypothetical protein